VNTFVIYSLVSIGLSEMVEAEFQVTWEEFHSILRLGGDAGSLWASHALKNAKRLANILGDRRAAELVVLLETHSNVLLVPISGSRVSQTQQPKPAPPAIPLPFPPPLNRAPPSTHVATRTDEVREKIEVDTHPLSPNAHKAKPARAFTHSRKKVDDEQGD
jgi:hypothetical protein